MLYVLVRPFFAYPLSILLNKIIDSGKVPTEWKLAEICPVFKKNDAQDKAMYRPVSILVVLDKVFEKCLERQLIQYFNPILSPSLGNLRSTTKETTTTSIDRARTGTRTSFSVGEMKVKKRSAWTTTTTSIRRRSVGFRTWTSFS